MGYKYIYWDLNETNADFYLSKIQHGETIHHVELKNMQGFEDKECMPGIYFCENLDELFFWTENLFKEVYVDGIDILEIETVGNVKKKYNPHFEHRVSYVAEAVKARSLPDTEIPASFHRLFDKYFR